MPALQRFVVIRGTGRPEWDRWHDATHWDLTNPTLTIPFRDQAADPTDSDYYRPVVVGPSGESETDDEGRTAAVWAPIDAAAGS